MKTEDPPYLWRARAPVPQTFAEADRRKGQTGENLLQLLESRLDAVAYRMGFGASRSESRQVVRHNGVLVNGSSAWNIPSFLVRVEAMSSSCQAKDQRQLRVKARWKRQSRVVSPSGWKLISRTAGHLQGCPDRSELPSTINESLVVELYSK